MHAWIAEVSRTANACVSQVTTYRTSDGGRTWQQAGAIAIKTALPTDDIFNLCCFDWMDFVDPQHGWLLVASPPNPSAGPDTLFEASTLYATDDGGMHWRLVAANPGSATLSAGVADARPDISGTSAASGMSVRIEMIAGDDTARSPSPELLSASDVAATGTARRTPLGSWTST